MYHCIYESTIYFHAQIERDSFSFYDYSSIALRYFQKSQHEIRFPTKSTSPYVRKDPPPLTVLCQYLCNTPSEHTFVFKPATTAGSAVVVLYSTYTYYLHTIRGIVSVHVLENRVNNRKRRRRREIDRQRWRICVRDTHHRSTQSHIVRLTNTAFNVKYVLGCYILIFVSVNLVSIIMFQCLPMSSSSHAVSNITDSLLPFSLLSCNCANDRSKMTPASPLLLFPIPHIALF